MQSMIYLEGPTAVPHKDGEPVFQAPWEARAFALVLALLDRREFVWGEFRDRLVAEINAAVEQTGPEHDTGADYYERWLASFEKLLLEKSILTREEVEARRAALASARTGT